MTILANCKIISATGKPSDYVILSEAKNLSSSLKANHRNGQRCFAPLNMTEESGFGLGSSRWVRRTIECSPQLTHSNSKMILPLRLPCAACATAALTSLSG